MKHALPLLAALALAACVTPPVDHGPIGRDGEVGLGQAARVGALAATPLTIVEDSRCPINVRCVWAGRVTVRTRIDGAGWRETRDLTLGQEIAIRGTTLALVSVEPGKLAGAPTPPQAYRFGFAGGR